MTKFTELSTVESLDGDELLAITNDPSGTPASRAITSANLLKMPHGQIYAPDVSSSQALAATTWTKVDQFTVDGLGSNVTRDHANDKLIPLRTGRHFVSFKCSFEGDVGTIFKFAVHLNGVLQAAVRDQAKPGAGGWATVSAQGVVQVATASVDLDETHDRVFARVDPLQ